MPRSSVAMSEHDGEYFFDIDKYLCGMYPNITKPERRAICGLVRDGIDDEAIEEMIDQIVLEYALDRMGWTPPEEDDSEGVQHGIP